MENRNKTKLTMRTKISYGCGDFGSVLMNIALTTYFMYYCTNIVGISLAAVGTITLVCKIWDGVNDVIVGILVDKTRHKDGKARPWIKWFTIPCSMSIIIMFTIPVNAAYGVKIAWAFIGYFLYALFYTTVNLPYGSLLPLMTRDTAERSSLATYRQWGANLSSLLTSMVYMPLIKWIQGKTNNEALGYSLCIVVAAIAAAILLYVVYFNCREMEEAMDKKAAEPVSAKKSVYSLSHNRPWIITALITIINFMCPTLTGSAMMYLIIYYFKAGETYISLFTTLGTLGGLFMLPLVTPLCKKLGYRKSLTAIYAAGALLYMGGYFARTNMYMALLFYILVSFTNTFRYTSTLSMLADTIEYSDYMHNVRVDGLGYAANSFGTKVGPGIATMICSFVLAKGMLDTSVGVGGAQPESALFSIQLCMYIIPAALSALAAILTCFYNLDQKKYAKVLETLENRRMAED